VVEETKKSQLKEELLDVFNSKALTQLLMVLSVDGYNYVKKVSDILGKSPSIVKEQLNTLKEFFIVSESGRAGIIQYYQVNENFLKEVFSRYWVENFTNFWQLLGWNPKEELLRDIFQNISKAPVSTYFVEYFKEISKRFVSELEKLDIDERKKTLRKFNVTLFSLVTNFLISFLLYYIKTGIETIINNVPEKMRPVLQDIINISEVLIPVFQDSVSVVGQIVSKHENQ